MTCQCAAFGKTSKRCYSPGVISSIAGYPAPLKIGTQMFAQATIMKMIAQCTQSGKSINAAMDWAESEIEGFMRT